MTRSSKSPLAPLYLIADMETAGAGDIDLVDVVTRFVAAGGRMVSLRPGGIDDRAVVEVGKKLAGLIYAAGGTFLVHRRVDVAQLLGADGVHLPGRGMTPAEVHRITRDKRVVGRSCHDAADVRRAADAGADFVTLGPMFESVSKPGYGPGIDTATFQRVCREVQIPVYALGGVVPSNVDDCFQASAGGVAVLGGIVQAEDPRRATEAYLAAIRSATAS